MQVSGQKRLWLMASTISPNARSLSATCAAENLDFVGAVGEVAIKIEKFWRTLFCLILPMRLCDRGFTIIAERLAMGERIVPDKTGGRISESIHFVVSHEIGVAAGKTCKRALFIIRG